MMRDNFKVLGRESNHWLLEIKDTDLRIQIWHTLEHKFGLVYTLLHRCFCLVTAMSKFHFEIEKLN